MDVIKQLRRGKSKLNIPESGVQHSQANTKSGKPTGIKKSQPKKATATEPKRKSAWEADSKVPVAEERRKGLKPMLNKLFNKETPVKPFKDTGERLSRLNIIRRAFRSRSKVSPNLQSESLSTTSNEKSSTDVSVFNASSCSKTAEKPNKKERKKKCRILVTASGSQTSIWDSGDECSKYPLRRRKLKTKSRLNKLRESRTTISPPTMENSKQQKRNVSLRHIDDTKLPPLVELKPNLPQRGNAVSQKDSRLRVKISASQDQNVQTRPRSNFNDVGETTKKTRTNIKALPTQRYRNTIKTDGASKPPIHQNRRNSHLVESNMTHSSVRKSAKQEGKVSAKAKSSSTQKSERKQKRCKEKSAVNTVNSNQELSTTEETEMDASTAVTFSLPSKDNTESSSSAIAPKKIITSHNLYRAEKEFDSIGIARKKGEVKLRITDMVKEDLNIVRAYLGTTRGFVWWSEGKKRRKPRTRKQMREITNRIVSLYVSRHILKSEEAFDTIESVYLEGGTKLSKGFFDDYLNNDFLESDSEDEDRISNYEAYFWSIYGPDRTSITGLPPLYPYDEPPKRGRKPGRFCRRRHNRWKAVNQLIFLRKLRDSARASQGSFNNHLEIPKFLLEDNMPYKREDFRADTPRLPSLHEEEDDEELGEDDEDALDEEWEAEVSRHNLRQPLSSQDCEEEYNGNKEAMEFPTVYKHKPRSPISPENLEEQDTVLPEVYKHKPRCPVSPDPEEACTNNEPTIFSTNYPFSDEDEDDVLMDCEPTCRYDSSDDDDEFTVKYEDIVTITS